MAYQPGRQKVGEPSPQTDSDLFTDDDIRAEIKYLVRLDRRYGIHVLRAEARLKLFGVLEARALAKGELV